MNQKWSVLWEAGDSILHHRCGNDLDEAIRVYNLAIKAGRHNVTLRCDNVGLPPPEKFQRMERRNIGGQTKKEEKWVRVLVVMEAANKRGIFWCPYCRKFRRFGHQFNFYVEGRWARHPNKAGMMACPTCGISHRDFHVRKWNPHAAAFYARETRRKRGRRST